MTLSDRIMGFSADADDQGQYATRKPVRTQTTPLGDVILGRRGRMGTNGDEEDESHSTKESNSHPKTASRMQMSHARVPATGVTSVTTALWHCAHVVDTGIGPIMAP